MSGYAGTDTDIIMLKLLWKEDCPLEKQSVDATYQGDFVS
jgi:hypothetical protein